jgi:hypothetical protein
VHLNLHGELLKFTLELWLSRATASYKFKGALASEARLNLSAICTACDAKKELEALKI